MDIQFFNQPVLIFVLERETSHNDVSLGKMFAQKLKRDIPLESPSLSGSLLYIYSFQAEDAEFDLQHFRKELGTWTGKQPIFIVPNTVLTEVKY